MRQEQISLELLLPIETHLDWRQVWYIQSNFDEAKAKPVLVVPFNDSYIMADGHHTTSVRVMQGRKVIPGTVLESDKEVAASNRGIFRKYRRNGYSITTVDYLLQLYQTKWCFECENAGIRKVEDLLEGRTKIPLWMNIFYSLTDLR